MSPQSQLNYSYLVCTSLNPTHSPISEAYKSAVDFASKPDFFQKAVTREEYNEMGSNACRRKFPNWRPVDAGDILLNKGKGRAHEEEEPTPSKRGTRGRGRGSTRGRGDPGAPPRRRGRPPANRAT